MKNQRLNTILGATAGCTVQMLEGLIGMQDANVGHGLKGNAWFGSVRAAAALGVTGSSSSYAGQNKQQLIPQELDGMPGGVKIVLKGAAPNEILLVAIGYR